MHHYELARTASLSLLILLIFFAGFWCGGRSSEETHPVEGTFYFILGFLPAVGFLFCTVALFVRILLRS